MTGSPRFKADGPHGEHREHPLQLVPRGYENEDLYGSHAGIFLGKQRILVYLVRQVWGAKEAFLKECRKLSFLMRLKSFRFKKKKERDLFAEVSFGDCCLQYKSFFQRTLEQRDVMGRKCYRDKNDFPVFRSPARGFRYSEFVFLPAFI